jgi:predicted DNA-binding WGR domain protein
VTHPDRLEPLKAEFHLCACYWVYLTPRIPSSANARQEISTYDHPYEDAQVDLKQHAQLPGGAKAAQEYESWVEQQEKHGYVGKKAKDLILAHRAKMAWDRRPRDVIRSQPEAVVASPQPTQEVVKPLQEDTVLKQEEKLLEGDSLTQEYKAVLKLIDSLETIPENKIPSWHIKSKYKQIEPMLNSLRAQTVTHPDRLEPLKADFHLRACYWVYLSCMMPEILDMDTFEPISRYDHPYEDTQVDLEQHARLPGGAEAVQAYESWVEEQEKRGYVGQTAKNRVLARRVTLAMNF